MTFGELLDAIEYDTSESGAAFRAGARRWLNLVRTEAAGMGPWRTSIDPNASMDTDVAHPTGIYELPAAYDQVLGEWMFDQTGNAPLKYDPQVTVWLYDPTRVTTGPPARWADGGFTTAGARQIVFWPIPNDVRTIRFSGLRKLADIGANEETLAIDPYFGPIVQRWQHAFSIGLQYHSHHRNSEQASQWRAKYADFKRAVIQCRATDGLPAGALLSPMGPQTNRLPGRLDPAHYQTPW